MYSRCPHCHRQQRIKTRQLQKTRGLLVCKNCRQRFDGLAELTDRMDTALDKQDEPAFLTLPQTPHPRHTAGYCAGSTLLILLAMLQLGVLNPNQLPQQPALHRALNWLCNALNCRLPQNVNLDDWTLSHSDLQLVEGSHWIFSAALTLEGKQSQPSPYLQLNLLDYSGQTIATRHFSPQQYLAGQPAPDTRQTVAVRLDLAYPAAKIGGFTANLHSSR